MAAIRLGGAAQAVVNVVSRRAAQRTNHFVIRMSGTLPQPANAVKRGVVDAEVVDAEVVEG